MSSVFNFCLTSRCAISYKFLNTFSFIFIGNYGICATRESENYIIFIEILKPGMVLVQDGIIYRVQYNKVIVNMQDGLMILLFELFAF